MKVYIDNNYKCHASNDGTFREIESSFFDNKCSEFINGYRYVPNGETWVDEDGTEYTGELITPYIPYEQLMYAQNAYNEANIITRIITGEVSINDEI